MSSRDWNKRNNNGTLKVALETYKDFAQNTGIHGIKYTVSGDVSKVEKVIWIVGVLLGIMGAGYMTKLFWGRYTSNPTRTLIANDFSPVSSIPFPAVTICNVNRIIGSKMDELVEKLQYEDEEEKIFIRNTLPQLLAYISPYSVNHSETDLLRLQKALQKNGYSDPSSIMNTLSQTCNEMIVKCTWGIYKEDCKNSFRMTVTAEGPCCSFNNYIERNKPSNPKYTQYSGTDHGLTLLMDPMIEDVQYSSIHTSGLKVYVHDFKLFPDIDTFTKIVSVGKVTFLQVIASKLSCSNDVKRLSVNQRKCLYFNERKLKYFNEYYKANCMTECKIKTFLKKCKCVPFYFTVLSDKDICNISKIPCLNEARKDRTYIGISGCDCPSQCEQIFYEVMSTTTRLIYKPNITINSFLVGEERRINENSIILHIYFGRQTHSVLLRDTITSTSYLLSSFGGVYSLFMGCSFMTLVELVYYIFMRFLIKLKLLRKMGPARPAASSEERTATTHGHMDNIYPVYLKRMGLNRKPNIHILYNQRSYLN